MARALAITGAGGFVGRHLVRHAHASGWDVIGVVRTEDNARSVAEAGGRPVTVASGLAPAGLAPAFEAATVVVHLAQIGAERSGESYEAVNIAGTRHVIAAARAASVGRLIFFSGLGVARYGMAPRCTNLYFLSKLAAEVELYRSDLEAVVFRPSYIVGPGDGLVTGLLREMAAGQVEWPGDGGYRLQPVFVADAAAAVLAAAQRPRLSRRERRVTDLVGPEAIAYRELVERLARVAKARGLVSTFAIRGVAIEEAERQAAAGGYRGMLSDELDCLLCDETADPQPLAALLGRPLTKLDEAFEATIVAGAGG